MPREPLVGVLFFYSESGTEGGYWAFQDERFITENTTKWVCSKCNRCCDGEARSAPLTEIDHSVPITEALELLEEEECNEQGPGECQPGEHDFQLSPRQIWSYEGQHILEDEDILVICDKENHEQVLWQGDISLIEYELFTEEIFGLWIHSEQRDVERETWATWFLGEYPAKFFENSPRRHLSI